MLLKAQYQKYFIKRKVVKIKHSKINRWKTEEEMVANYRINPESPTTDGKPEKGEITAVLT